jgi:hypothetical protein
MRRIFALAPSALANWQGFSVHDTPLAHANAGFPGSAFSVL